MRLQKKNVKVAIWVICAVLAIFTALYFLPENILAFIGERLYLPLESVQRIQSYIIIIASGMLGSTIVALIFYRNEYYSEKQKTIISIINESYKIQELYNSLPYTSIDGDYCKLERAYYYEYIENKWKKEQIERADELLKRHTVGLPDEERKEYEELDEDIKKGLIGELCYDSEDELRRFLDDNPQIRKRRFDENKEISTEQKMRDIITAYDLYIDESMNIYKSILNVNLDVLFFLTNGYDSFYGYSKKTKRNIGDKLNVSSNERNNIIPKNAMEELSSNYISDRIFKVHDYFQRKIRNNLEDFDNPESPFQRVEIMQVLMMLQKEVYGEAIHRIGQVDENGERKEFEISYAFNKLKLCLRNLGSILLSEIEKDYKLYSEFEFAIPGKSVEYGGVSTTKVKDVSEIYGSIYRE